MHRIIILGPQGSGKGTQANILADKLGVPALSMGELLRDEVGKATEIGLKIKQILDGGNLVSDEIALSVLGKRLEEEDAKKGYVLDGYPRNVAQYAAFQSLDDPTALLVIDVPRAESMNRLMKRMEIEGRSDDTQEAIEKRLAVYEEDTKPVIQKYQELGIVKMINGVGTIEEVAARIIAALHLD